MYPPLPLAVGLTVCLSFPYSEAPERTEESAKQWAWTDVPDAPTGKDANSDFCIISAVNSKAMVCTVRWFEKVEESGLECVSTRQRLP